MTIYFLMTAILDFGRSEIWRYFCFRGVRFSLWDKFCVNSCNINRLMADKVIFQNGRRRHLGFFGSEIWRQLKSRAARIYLQTKFGEDISNGGRVMAVYVFSKWRLSAILNYYLAILDHPRSFLVDLKLVFKFRVDRIYICEDISDRTFRKFGLKRLFAPHKFTF